jgi:hypothetical protein
LPASIAVKDKLAEVESTLASAVRKHDGKAALSGPEIARLSTEHARLLDLTTRCANAQGELYTAEELCLEALARDVDAIDLIEAAIAQRHQFRRDLFWLLTAMRPVNSGAILLVHSPDARAATVAWVKLVLEAAVLRNWTAHVHLWGDTAKDWKFSSADRAMWGPPHDLAWANEHLAERSPPAALVRIRGPGADHLFGLEGGLQRFHNLAGGPCHVWVDLLEPRGKQLEQYAALAKSSNMATTDGLLDAEWFALPQPPSVRAPRGAPIRELIAEGTTVISGGEELEIPWSELPRRLEEVAVARLLPAIATDTLEKLWTWERPFAEVEKLLAELEAEKGMKG